MRTFTLQEVKNNLSSLIESTQRGGGFIIAQDGLPSVQVLPLNTPKKKKRKLGFLKGKTNIPDDILDSCDDEINEMFYGDSKL